MSEIAARLLAQIRQLGGQGLIGTVEGRRHNRKGVACISPEDRVQDESVGVTAECDRGSFQACYKELLC